MTEPRKTAITRLSLSDFRNYEILDQQFGDRSVVLYGANGAGKTNLLEAISLLGPGRGLRRTVFTDLARAPGDGGWAVAAEAVGAIGAVRLGTGLVAAATDAAGQGSAPGSTQRQCRIDGHNVKSSGAFADHLRFTWATPAQDRLFTGPAADRRRFLDRLVAGIDPGHSRTVQTFEHAMKERNRQLASGVGDPGWLSATEAQMAEAGVAMAAGRAGAVTRLAGLLGDRAQASPFPPAKVALEGDLEARLKVVPAVEVEDEYRLQLQATRAMDRAAGRALAGPHRSDLAVVHGVTGIEANRCSTGEQKALLIAMILAEARLITANFGGFTPILLLDEIVAHLDARRRAALFGEIEALGAQAWLTGTDRMLFSELESRAVFVCVQGGRLAAEDQSAAI